MSDYPITLEEIVSWLRSKDQVLKDLGITLANVRKSHTDKPAAVADFDTGQAIGQNCTWVSGEIDFEVLRVSDGKNVFLPHEKVSNLLPPSLEVAYSDFLRSMMHLGEAI